MLQFTDTGSLFIGQTLLHYFVGIIGSVQLIANLTRIHAEDPRELDRDGVFFLDVLGNDIDGFILSIDGEGVAISVTIMHIDLPSIG